MERSLLHVFKNVMRPNDSVVVNKNEPIKLNYDSLYKQMLQDGLLTLNSDSANEWIINSDLKNGTFWTDGGPTNYTIQTIINREIKTVNFKCPNYYYYQRGIKEFQFPLKVISSLLKLTGINKPC